MADVGLILILVVLLLGGLIANLGDRIGTKVGKARLSLFNLRPRTTAVVVTVLTGVMISASTLGVLLLASSSFREMVFKFGSIRDSLDRTRKDLDRAKTEIDKSSKEKDSIESELTKSRTKSRQVQKTLDQINESLKTAIARQQATEARRQAVERQAVTLRSEILSLQQEQQVLANQRDEVRAQIAQRDQDLAARTGEIAARDREIQTRQAIIARNADDLKKLDQERNKLLQESQSLAQTVTDLKTQSLKLRGENLAIRLGLPAIPVNKLLASRTFAQVRDQRTGLQVINEVITLANANAFQQIKPGIPRVTQIVNTRSEEIQQTFNQQAIQMMDGGAYLLQVRSAGNYFLGENVGEDVLVNIRTILVPYREIFPAGSSLASVKIDPTKISLENLQEELLQLVPKSRQLISSRGWLPDVGNEGVDVSQVPNLRNFVSQIRDRSEPIEIRAISSQPIFPDTSVIPLELIALERGVVILQTRDLK